jgi:lipopolysaccharide transport system ATP-binding protein
MREEDRGIALPGAEESGYWPPAQAFWVPGPDEQRADEGVRCVGVVVLDAEGRPIQAAAQGEVVQLLFAFDVRGLVGVVAGSFELRTPAGMLVHGKTSFQAGTVVQLTADRVVRVRHRFMVRLDVSPGTYRLSVCLKLTDEASYAAYRDEVDAYVWPPSAESVGDRAKRYKPCAQPEEQFDAAVRECCRVDLPETIAVGFDRRGRRNHTGLLELPGCAAVDVDDVPAVLRSRATPRTRALPAPIAHVTHHKAGSQWIYGILRACVPDRLEAPGARGAHFRYWPPEPNKIYPTVYLTKQEFDAVPGAATCRKIVVIRDLRDTLVSAYFSFAASHRIAERGEIARRAFFASVTQEEGLLYLIDDWLAGRAQMQISWLEAGERVLRYEELLQRDVEILEAVLLDELELGVPRDRFREAVIANRFEQVAGRPLGAEDRGAHLRTGAAGDWRNHFTDRVKDAFKTRYGGVLVASGYEQDLEW